MKEYTMLHHLESDTQRNRKNGHVMRSRDVIP